MGLGSIVVSCYDGLSYTRLFVESVLRTTDFPYELIFVDNGSTDGTADYLATVPGARVIRNEVNAGLPHALNQGVAAARGDVVAVCNNDLIVTPGWLSLLVGELEGAADAGIVCPADNAIVTAVLPHLFPEEREAVAVWPGCPPDRPAVDDVYGGSLDAFSLAMRRKYAGRRFPHANGACMLIRRELIADIGPFDESLGVVMYEDVDYFLRTLLNPRFNAVYLCPSAFVHHFCSRTVSAFDVQGLLRQARENFLRKWPAEQRAALRRLHPQCADVIPPPALLG